MSAEAWNKITQTHDLFKKIISPLKQYFGLTFGYLKVLSGEGRYYRLMENLDCNKNLILNLKSGKIFCGRNITSYFDSNYLFTLWPKIPNHHAMDICHKFGVWNGVTVVKKNSCSIDLYWFNTDKYEEDRSKFFMENKLLFVEFISYFEKYKKILGIKDGIKKIELFKFEKGFDITIPESDNINYQHKQIEQFLRTIHLSDTQSNFINSKIHLSRREQEILRKICYGYTAKLIAQDFKISLRTVECYIERIKNKTGMHYKTELVKFGENYFQHLT